MKVLYMFGIDDPFIWLAYLASILSALGCLIYGAYQWRGGDEEQTVKSTVQKLPNQEQ
jgi:4-hydroxybenzoate polyprenyltransferase